MSPTVMGEMLPSKTSCISVSMSLVLRSEAELIFGFEYATTVTLLVMEAVYPLESVTVSVMSRVPDVPISPRVRAAPVVLDFVTPLHTAE